MKKLTKIFTVIILALSVVFAAGCKKEKEPVVETSEVGNITETSATCGGIVTSDGNSSVIERGVCWSKESNPIVSGNHLVAEGGVGSFNCTLTGLEPNTTYYVKAYAINNVGVAYGTEISFVTLEEKQPPVVSILGVTEITESSAVCVASIDEEGSSAVIEKGFCWSKENNPTLDDSHLTVSPTEPFEGFISGLELNTMYYLRAYAISGDGTGYSPEISFTTLSSVPPTISVLEKDGFVENGAMVELNVEYEFGFEMSSSVGLSLLTVIIGNDVFEQVWEQVDLSGLTSCTYMSSFVFTMEKVMDFTFTASVTDVNGKSSSASLTVFVNDEPQLEPSLFEWRRDGAAPGEGLEEFGLCWNSNAKDIFARIKPLEGVLLFSFDSYVWGEVTTNEEKAAVFEEVGMPISEYANVSVTHTANYDDVIGTILPNGTMYLIHVTYSETYVDGLSHYVIIGEWK